MKRMCAIGVLVAGAVAGSAQVPPEVFLNDRNQRDQHGQHSPIWDFSLASTMHLNEADQLKATYASEVFSPYIASLQVGASYYVYVLETDNQNLCALQYLGPGLYSKPACVGVGAPPGHYCCGTESLVLHPDGTKLYVVVNFENIVEVDIGAPNYTALTVNPNTLRLTNTTGGGIPYVGSIAITPDGKRLLAGGSDRLYDVDTNANTGLMKQILDVRLPWCTNSTPFATYCGEGIGISPNPAKPFALIGDKNGDGVYKIDLATLRSAPTFVRIQGPNLGISYGGIVFHESGNYAYSAFCGSSQCVLPGVGLIDVFGLSNGGTPSLTIQGGGPSMVAYALQYNPAYHRLYVSSAFNADGLRTFNVSADGSMVTFDTSYMGTLPDLSVSLAVPQIPLPSTRTYVANTVSHSVSVIDPATNAVVATIRVGAHPAHLAVTPNGSRVYVANAHSHDVSVINTATNTVVATVLVGSNPVYVATTPNGASVYVVNSGSGSVSAIDTATDLVVATINVGVSPERIAFTANGAHAYVTNKGSHNVSVIDTATHNVVATVPVGVGPIEIVIH